MALRKNQKIKFNPKIAPCLRANHHNTEDIHYLETGGTEPVGFTRATSPPSPQPISLTMTSWLEVFLASRSLLLGNVEGLMTPEEHCFLKSQGFSETKDPDVYYSKTLKAYYLMTVEKLSKPYLKHSPTLGIELNGRYLILKTSEFRRTGNECSLSDILEDQVDDKYFLSDSNVEKLITYNDRQIKNKNGFRAKFHKETDTMQALKIGETGSDDLLQQNVNGSKDFLTDGQKE